MIVDPAALWAEGAQEPKLPEVHPDFPAEQACPQCGAASPLPSAKFCFSCGVSLLPPAAQEWVCGQGHLSEAQYKFCPQCGDPCPSLRAPVTGAGAAVELAARPRPYEELSPAERAERDRQHIEAVSLGKRDPGLTYEPPRTQETELIHFLADGLSFAGTVWFLGQELELDKGSPRWAEAQAWINMSDFDQMERFGKVMFRKGPWPGKRYVDALAGQPPPEGAPDVKQLLEAEARERSRRRGVPRRVR